MFRPAQLISQSDSYLLKYRFRINAGANVNVNVNVNEALLFSMLMGQIFAETNYVSMLEFKMS